MLGNEALGCINPWIVVKSQFPLTGGNNPMAQAFEDELAISLQMLGIDAITNLVCQGYMEQMRRGVQKPTLATLAVGESKGAVDLF